MSPCTKKTKENLHGGCPTTLSTFLHPQCALTLKDYTGTGIARRCDVCRDRADGLVYQCKGCDFDVHPLCTSIPRELSHVLHPNHKLIYQLYVPRPCAGCGSMCTGWRYACAGCGFDIHPECVLRKSCDVNPTNISRSLLPPPPTCVQPPPLPPPYAAYASGVPSGFALPYNCYDHFVVPNMQYQYYAYPGQYPYYMMPYNYNYGNHVPVHGGVATGSAAHHGGSKMSQIISQLALGVISNVIFGELSSIW